MHTTLLVLFGILLSSCNSDQPELNAIYFSPVNIKTSNIDVSIDRILIYGTRSDGKEAFAKFYTSAPEIDLELRRGNWTFYGLAYQTTSIKKCSKLEAGLGVKKKFLTLDFQNSTCGESVFLGTDPTLDSNLTPDVEFANTAVEFCESVEGISTHTDECSDDLALFTNRKQARGHGDSFQYRLMAYDKTSGQYTFTDSILSTCRTGTPNGSSLRGLATQFMGFDVPAGDTNLAPFYVRLEIFPASTNCTVGTPHQVNLPNGLRSSVPNAQYVVQTAANSIHKLYIQSSTAEICTASNSLLEFAGGLGTIESPKLICNEDQLYHIFPLVGSYAVYTDYSYKLLKDLDISARSIGTNFFPVWASCVSPGDNFMPIGTTFGGGCTFDIANNVHFDGGGKTITGMRITRAAGTVAGFYYATRSTNNQIRRLTLKDSAVSVPQYGGTLVGDSERTIFREIKLINPQVTVAANNAGGLTGTSAGDTFQNIIITNADIEGAQFVGGIFGTGVSRGGVQTSMASAHVRGAILSTSVNSVVGGLAGSMGVAGVQSRIDLSSFRGSVEGTQEVGGLVGEGTAIRITDSYAHGMNIKSLATTNARMGGLVGELKQKVVGGGIFTSYFYGNIDENCTLNDVNCLISTLVGTTDGSYINNDFSTAIYNISAEKNYTLNNYGHDQPDAEFFTAIPFFQDNLMIDITPAFSAASWEFRNGNLPLIITEP